MDPYSSSGYRSDRAREQAKAFKTPPPAGGFLAPGFPVDITPPPAVTAPAAAAGGAAAGGFIAATIGGVVAGGILGYEVRKDIKKWDKNAKQPFYDAAKWQKHYSDDDFYEVMFDQAADDLYKDHLYDLLKNYSDHDFHLWSVGHYAGTGTWENADYDHYYCPNQLPHDAFEYEANGTFAGCPFPSYFPSTVFPHVDSTTVANNPQTVMLAELPGRPTINYFVRRPATTQGVLQQQFGYVGQAQAGVDADFVEGQTFVQTGVAFIQAEDYVARDYPTTGGEPSLEEQLADTALPRGRSYRGYTVPFSLAHPFTVINVLPGSAPVTVPGVEIDPGSETDPGSVTIVPPLEPPFPDAGEAKQQKPRLQRFIHAGHVAINFATETNDLFQALVKGLPKKLRPKGPRGAQAPPWKILQAIWDHWDEFDSQVALEAFVNNQIEDAIYGRYFGLKARAQRRLGVSAGLARGVRGTPYTRQFSGTQTLVVPEVHFAHGAHTVSFGDYEVNLVPGS